MIDTTAPPLFVKQFSTPFDVPHDFSSPTNFSPPIGHDFVGIVINAPEKVMFDPHADGSDQDGFAHIPVSMTYRFSHAFLKNIAGPTVHHMTVVAVPVKAGKPYSSTLQMDEAAPYKPDGRPQPTQEELESRSSKGYFTFNLAAMLNLPKEEATYHVHVTLEKYQSNVITIALKKKGK